MKSDGIRGTATNDGRTADLKVWVNRRGKTSAIGLSPKRSAARAACEAARECGNSCLRRTMVELEYERIELHGFNVHFRKGWFDQTTDRGRTMVRRMARQAEMVRAVFPEDALRGMRHVRIWVDWEPSEWVRAHGIEPVAYYLPFRSASAYGIRLTEKAGDVTVLAKDWLDNPLGQECDKYGWLVHELAHAYEDRHPDIMSAINDAYRAAIDGKIYQRAGLQLLFLGSRSTIAPIYAASNASEYFAELTVAHLARNWDVPTDRMQLKRIDPRGHRLMMSVWGDNAGRRDAISHATARKMTACLVALR